MIEANGIEHIALPRNVKGLVPRKNQKFEIHIFLFIRKSYAILQKTA